MTVASRNGSPPVRRAASPPRRQGSVSAHPQPRCKSLRLCVKQPCFEQVELGASVGRSVHQLQAVDLPLTWPLLQGSVRAARTASSPTSGSAPSFSGHWRNRRVRIFFMPAGRLRSDSPNQCLCRTAHFRNQGQPATTRGGAQQCTAWHALKVCKLGLTSARAFSRLPAVTDWSGTIV